MFCLSGVSVGDNQVICILLVVERRLSSVLTVDYWVSLKVVVVGSGLSGVGCRALAVACRVYLLVVPSYISLVVKCRLSIAC